MLLTSAASPASLGLTVTSTLDGMSSIPVRSHWIASTKGSATVSEVDFLIDGHLRWIEHGAPYYYGGDHNGQDAGFLITTWLTPGKHRFTVQAVDSAGQKAIDTAVATVAAVPPPPAALIGAWTRSVTAQDAQKAAPQYGGSPPVGSWKLIFDRVGAWELDPKGGGLVNEYDAEGGTLHVYAPIEMTPQTSNGPGSISKFGHRIDAGGGTDCTAAGPFGTYRWAVTGTTLTLTATHEGCPDRGAVWEGTWTRTT
jgi:hypothetical protein